MADRRMFAKSVLLFGKFSELSRGAQVLYIILNVLADDDGFVGNPKPALRQTGCTKKDLQTLLEEGLLLEFPTGPVVVTHWHIHNSVRKDRYKPTIYQAEYAQLTRTESNTYRFLTPEERLSSGCQMVDHPATQDRIGEDRLGEVREGKKSTGDQMAPEALSSSSSYSDFEKMVLDTYQKHCTKLAECRYLDEATRKHIGQLEKRSWTAASLEDAFRKAGECPFLYGQNERGWKADLEWLCQEDNLRKVCAGKYQTYKKQEATPYGCKGMGQAEMEEIQKLLREG